MKTNYFKCYSIPLKNYLDANMVNWISKGGNPDTNKVFYVYEMTPRLSELLYAWSKRGRELKKKEGGEGISWKI